MTPHSMTRSRATSPSATPLTDAYFALMAKFRPIVRQERTWLRLVHLSVGCVLSP